jgi:hypothetical protein
MRSMRETESSGAPDTQPSSGRGLYCAPSIAAHSRARLASLDDVTDPELRDVMEAVLEEDRDLIEYLADR